MQQGRSLLATPFPAGISPTCTKNHTRRAKNCVLIDLPTKQISLQPNRGSGGASGSASSKQQAAGGSPWAPRKRQLRPKSARVERAKMFAKLRHAKYFKVSARPNAVSMGFVGRLARIARVHQEGLAEKAWPDGPRVSCKNPPC